MFGDIDGDAGASEEQTENQAQNPEGAAEEEKATEAVGSDEAEEASE